MPFELIPGENQGGPVDLIRCFASNTRRMKKTIPARNHTPQQTLITEETSTLFGNPTQGTRTVTRTTTVQGREIILDTTRFLWDQHWLIEQTRDGGTIQIPRRLETFESKGIQIAVTFFGKIIVQSGDFFWEGDGVRIELRKAEKVRRQWLGIGLGEIALEGGGILIGLSSQARLPAL